ncbi:hypothetical protein PAECIP111802_01153 [Paenibacillus allorhizosphaerae]|uniref:Extracellular solute-binding protein n=1 Tax=Paenibacillus allorhizosphaerae TaxID=2849866 RepID=A0ABN7TF51_9BACL|nr:hypothetical protein PAECIP111802_01153 [Paenibacillus allorhizosphaerae]
MLARKLTREMDGTSYQGIYPGNWTQQRSQLSLDFVDPKSNKVIFESDPGYRKVFELYQSIYLIPGMLTTLNGKDGFFKSRQFAMYVNWLTDVLYLFEDAHKSGNPLSWDMMRLPYFTEKPGIGSKVDVHMLMVTAQSKQKYEAMAVVGFLTSSEAVQVAAAKTGRIPAIQSSEAQKQFGANYASVKDKNTKAVFDTKMAPLWNYSPYDVQAMYPPIEQAMKDVMNHKSDVNTALKTAAEKTNKLIEENPAR